MPTVASVGSGDMARGGVRRPDMFRDTGNTGWTVKLQRLAGRRLREVVVCDRKENAKTGRLLYSLQFTRCLEDSTHKRDATRKPRASGV
jgi:hypothetical protein